MGVRPKTLKMQHMPNVWASTTSGTIFQFTDTSYSRTKPAEKRLGKYHVVTWGKDNLYPYHTRQLLADNDIKQMLINTDVDITCGKSLIFYQLTDQNADGIKEIKPIRDAELEDWRDEWMLDEFFRETIQDYKEFGNSWAELIMTRDRTKVASLQSLDAVDCRLELPDGNKKNLLVADWKYSRLKESEVKQVPLLDFRRPVLGQHVKAALHCKIVYSGQPFYSLEDWHGTRDSTEVSNLITKFHKSGLKGGYALRYHVKIPISYLEERVAGYKADGKSETEAVQAVKKEIQEQLDGVLAGAENAQKSFISWINDHIPDPTGWEIEKIETDLKDDSYIKLAELMDKKHARGHNMHPVLAGIETSGSLSSGSEILNLANFHISYKTPRARRTGLRPINVAMKHNYPAKWAAGIRVGPEDVVLTTLDKNPKGQENVMQNGQ